ncbi:MAG: S1C family serine protease [Devosia sp.]
MKRRPLYSRSSKPRPAGDGPVPGLSPVYIEGPDAAPEGPLLRTRVANWWSGFYARRRAPVLLGGAALIALLIVGAHDLLRPLPEPLTQSTLNAAVNFAIDHRPPQPAATAVAYARIIPSVVRVDGYDPLRPNASGSPDERGGSPNDPTSPSPLHSKSAIPGYENSSVGTGTVIKDDGTILTNLHVAASAAKLRVTFADGTEANASIVGAEPENDMAILKPDKVPDDLQPATLASTAGLNPGDPVLATGFTFGIGPSTSAGIVSGLRREFEEEGRPRLSNLIQFDAAANPGNSGGPLVNMNGEVLGIVTAILNPSGSRTFAGIGFAVPIENAARPVMGESPL